ARLHLRSGCAAHGHQRPHDRHLSTADPREDRRALPGRTGPAVIVTAVRACRAIVRGYHASRARRLAQPSPRPGWVLRVMASNRLPVDSWVIRKSPEQIAEEPTMEHIGFAPDDDEFSSPIGGDYQDGWKVHISARPDQAAEVLDDAAAVLFAHRVPFKHLSCSRFFLLTGHKHAARQQAGKFIAAYPPDQATARRLLQALAEALADREGPFVLTDRRYGRSSVVHYRYGAFVPRQRVRADGHAEL